MTLARVTVTGKVTKNPEKRFTQNNLPITSFVIDANPQEETLLRVVVIGNMAERVADTLQVGDTALVDGRLQTANVKTTSGKDRKVFEINASSVEKISILSSAGGNYSSQGNFGASASQNYNRQNSQSQENSAPAQAPQTAPQNDIVQFATDEISEDLIDEDEIPF